MNSRTSLLCLLFALLLPCHRSGAQQPVQNTSEQIAGEPTKSYRGRVVDEHAAALAGVAVCIVPDGVPWLPEQLAAASTVHTDEHGEFVLQDVPAVAREVLFVARGRACVMQLLEHLLTWPVQMAKGSALAGVVRAKDGQVLAGARIVATDYLRSLTFVSEGVGHNTQAWLNSVAVTDGNGRFLLRGVYDTAMRLSVTALGYEDLEVAPVSKVDPLTMELDAVPVVTGIVLDPDGKPAAGVSVRSWGQHSPRPSSGVRTDAEGRFYCNWLGQPMTISVLHATATGRSSGRTALQDPGECKIQLVPLAGAREAVPASRASRLASPEQRLLVHAKLSNLQPCPDYRVAVFQIDSDVRQQRRQAGRGDVKQLQVFADSVTYGVDGDANALVYKGNGSGELLVMAMAQGQAMVRKVIAGDAENITLTFEPAQPIAGTVVDARSGKVIAGVSVWHELDLAGPKDLVGVASSDPVSRLRGTEFLATTDAAGAFELPHAPLDAGRLFLSCDGYVATQFACGEGVNRASIGVKMEPVVTLVGQVAPVPFAPQIVGAAMAEEGTINPETASELDGVQPLDRTGATKFPRQSVGRHHVYLVVQRMPRQGQADKVGLGALTVDHDTDKIALPAGPATPVLVRGKVSGNVPRQRLAVLSAPMPVSATYYAFLQYRGALCPVGIDGSYELLATPGKRTLVVIDFVSGVMFAKQQITVAADATLQQDFEVTGRAVTVRIESDDDDAAKPAEGWFVEFVTGREFWPGDVGQISFMSSVVEEYCKGMGVQVARAGGSATLWLPKTEGSLAVREYSQGSNARARGAARSVQAIDASKVGDITLRW